MQSGIRARSAGSAVGAAKAPTVGEQLEARVSQLWFWEGFYSRHGVNLQRHYQEPLTITDVDLFAFDFSPQLSMSKYIGEVKSGTGKNAAKPLDRIVWLRGIRELVGADSAELTIATGVTDRIRALGEVSAFPPRTSRTSNAARQTQWGRSSTLALMACNRSCWSDGSNPPADSSPTWSARSGSCAEKFSSSNLFWQSSS
ncbi:hypothetical protein ACFYXC_40080 [Streptomyces sp. NPDC002701]|uniref:hypothetical protein n=1 Tax=Streptomyces sp. NPDC002701 TaxID=3364661 RepID=UPI003699A636